MGVKLCQKADNSLFVHRSYSARFASCLGGRRCGPQPVRSKTRHPLNGIECGKEDCEAMSGMKNLVNSATRGLFAALLASSVVLYTFCPSAPSEAEAIPTAPEEAFQLRAANRDPVEGHWQQVAAERKSEGWWQENTHLWIDVSTKEELQRITRTVQAVDAPGESRATSKQQLGSRWTLVEFYATWCPACRRAYPHMCELAGDARLNQQLQFVRVNIDMARAWLPSMDLPGVPWIQVYDPHGRLQGSFAAVPDEDVLPQLEACLLAPSVPTDPNVTRTDAGEPVQQPLQDDDAPAWVGTAPSAHREYNERAATEKARFLEKYGSTYGYNGRIDELYAKEIGSRMAQSEHYLDYTGSSLYSNSQLREVMDELQGAVYGNPHSENPSSERSFAALEKMRGAVLDWLHADPGEYQVVFTRSCTDALKLVGENFPWTPTSHFKYLTANHNSVLGIRAYARMHDADFQALDEDEVEDWLAKTDSDCHAGRGDNDMQQLAAAALGTADDMSEAGVGATGPAYSLFAYPAEENFAGVKLPLDWVDRVHNKSSPGRHEWKVLLDAAAYVPTQPLDLRRVHPNFVTISFYKVFGYPTGLGALVINTEDAQLLHKSYFGGGSTAVATAHEDLAELKCHPAERLEDGTVAFLDIVALQAGLNMVDHLGGMGAVQQHVQALTDYGYERLSGLHHSNGAPLLRIYGKHERPDHSQVQGGIFNFLVLDPEGAAVSYRQVQRESAKAGLHIRTGCHCNPGACYGTLGIRDDEIRILAGQKQGCADDIEWLKVRREERQGRARQADGAAALVHGPANTDDFSVALAGAEEDLQAGGGTTMLLPLGSVRASLGYMSTFEDVDALASWLQATYTDRPA